MELSGKSNISPKIWGPFFWKTFHLSTFGYPEKPNDLDKQTYKLFYETFMKILPCNKCSLSSQKMLNDDLIKALESRDDLIKWGFDFHNSVNAKLEIKPLSFETFMNDMKTLLSRNKFTNFGTRTTTTTFTITIIVLFLILLYIIFKRYT
jgi:hypothetical protein